MDRDDELRAGTRLGRWVLEGRLGEGATSTVFAARHVDIARRAAVKVLRAARADDHVARARFAREADAAARVRHPNVAPVFDAGVEGADAYVVMELVEGAPLAHRIAADGPLDPARAARLGRDLCLALAAVHREGVVHRDVKPANVILARSAEGAERAVLVDFGVALLTPPEAHEAPLTMRGELVGTPAYMAPEQAEGRSADARSDVYALGVVLYECLTGRRPFEGPTWQSTLVAVSRARFTPPRTLRPAVPSALDAIVRRAMHRDPARRYASAMHLHDALDAWLAAPRPRGPAALAASIIAVALTASAIAGTAPPTSAARPVLASPAPLLPSAPPIAASPAVAPVPAATAVSPSDAPPPVTAPAPLRAVRRRAARPLVERGTHDALILPHAPSVAPRP